MAQQIREGKVSSSLFNSEQLKDIYAGKDRIKDFTWHHHQDIGRMQLIPRKIHNKTGHVGGMNVWPINKDKKK